jgi:hypothetical protein
VLWRGEEEFEWVDFEELEDYHDEIKEFEKKYLAKYIEYRDDES